MCLILNDISMMEKSGHLAYLKTHRAVVICVKRIEQEVCICWSIYGENKHTCGIKKTSAVIAAQSTPAATPTANKNCSKGSLRDFSEQLQRKKRPLKRFFFSFMIREENKMLGAKNFFHCILCGEPLEYRFCLSSLSEQIYQSLLMLSLLFLR